MTDFWEMDGSCYFWTFLLHENWDLDFEGGDLLKGQYLFSEIP